jgi:hypothetical protein
MRAASWIAAGGKRRGRARASWRSRSFTVESEQARDTTPPETKINSKKAKRKVKAGKTVKIAYRANELSTFECSLDGGAWTHCTSPTKLTKLAIGKHLFEVRATDDAGNVDETPAKLKIKVKKKKH